MGALLSLRKADAPDPAADVFVDFERAQPTTLEMDCYEAVQRVLVPHSGHLIDALRSYQGCGDFIRKAISQPSRTTEDEAWQAVCPAVAHLRELYEYSLVLSQAVLPLLKQLSTGDPLKNLEQYQALAKQFANILHFVLLVDDLKTSNPSIQNDFSYYRRTLSRFRTSGQPIPLSQYVLTDELANRMSLFYAYPSPMMRSLIEALQPLAAEQSTNVTECLSVMTSICMNAVSKERVSSGALKAFCLQVMVGCIILYDHIDPVGAFGKGSSVNVQFIQSDGGDQTLSLLNALRYSTKHLNDDSTPKPIKALLS